MKGSLLLVLGSSCGVGLALYGRGPLQEAEARAELIDVQGRPVGTAEFRQEEKGVRITLRLSKLPPGVHGVHLHEKGKCDHPDFKSGGEHFNPFKRKHGWLNPDGPHAGDLPNVTVGEDGTYRGTLFSPLLTLGSEKNSAVGTCLMIHAGADDGTTDPSGNSGDRIACGAVTRR